VQSEVSRSIGQAVLFGPVQGELAQSAQSINKYGYSQYQQPIEEKSPNPAGVLLKTSKPEYHTLGITRV